jgi:hypothetical protein
MESLNTMYSIPSSKSIKSHIASYCGDRPAAADAINNVYKLPSIDLSIRYLHEVAGSPTKAIWIKAICKIRYLSCPLVNVKNVKKYFPESEETQKGYMRSQRQGVQSIKAKAPTREAAN